MRATNGTEGRDVGSGGAVYTTATGPSAVREMDRALLIRCMRSPLEPQEGIEIRAGVTDERDPFIADADAGTARLVVGDRLVATVHSTDGPPRAYRVVISVEPIPDTPIPGEWVPD